MTSQYDTIEQSELTWLTQTLSNYLALHTAHAGHLPHNFLDSTSDSPLSDSDKRWTHLNRIGYLNYSIFVNLALAKAAASSVPANPRILDVYDLTGRFFLRLGAAIDQTEALEVECARSWNGTDLSRRKLPNPSLYQTLRANLQVVDTYNNFLKHNGLPAIEVTTDGTLTVPDSLDYKKQKLWADQKPSSDLNQLLASSSAKTFENFNDFFGELSNASVTRIAGLRLKLKPPNSVVGIQTLVSTAHSGSLPGLDGYQPALIPMGTRTKP